MIKVFTLNKNDKIELSKEELQKLLDDAYWEGYNTKSSSWTYKTPSRWWDDVVFTTSTNDISTNIAHSTDTITLNNKG